MTTKINNEHKKVYAPNLKDKGNGIRNVPNLRFPEFEGEWEKQKLCDISFIVGRIGFRGYTTNDIVEKGMGAISLSPTNIVNNQLTYDKDNTYISMSKYEESPEIMINRGDVIFVKTGSTVGKVAYVDKLICKTTLNPQVVVLKDIKCDNYILSVIMSTRKFQNKIQRITVGGAVPTLSQVAMGNIFVSLPAAKEQEKISKFISLIDERIATQNKIIEDLKKLKSAIIEKVFCSPNQKNPMCRIEGFEQALSTYKMSDFSSRIATKNKDSKCSLVLTIAAQYGLVNQESFFNKSIASENLTGYYLLHKGEFAYNRSYSAGYDWGAVKRLDNYDEGVLSTLYICFKINETIVDSDYLAYYFESTKWHRGLSDIAGEGARNHGLLNVSMADYFNTKHRFPVIEEQKAIAKKLNAITEKERKATLLGECYQKQKQYLLRQMFI